MSVLPLEDTGELRLFVEETVHRIKNDPRRAGALDVMLLAGAIGVAVVVVMCLTLLSVASDHFHVESGRVLLGMATAGTVVTPTLLAMWGVLRVNRRRDQAMMAKLDRIRCDCAGGADVKDVAKRAFDMGRRIERREGDA